jgi:ABC-type multidrug transport system permease subunit
MIWAIAFPILLATLFFAMLGDVDETYTLEPITLYVVDDANWQADGAQGFRELVSQLSAGEDAVFAPSFVATAEEAMAGMEAGEFYGYIWLDSSAAPHFAADSRYAASVNDPSLTVVTLILDRYVRDAALVAEIAASNPAVFADPAFLEALYDSPDLTVAITTTAHKPSDLVRYMYVALGFAAFMMSTISVHAVSAARANLSPLGARRAVSGISQLRILTATLLASWVIGFAVLTVGYLYIRFAFGLDFSGQDAGVAITLLAGSLSGTAVGALIGALPIHPGAKGGLTAGLSCFLSLFAGMYGPGSQELGNTVARELPLAAWANPVRQVYDAFMATYYYDGLGHLLPVAGRLVLISLGCCAIAALLMRRQRYDHL